MKAPLVLEIRYSILELACAKLTFSKSDLLDLVNFDFLDLAKFAIVNRFLILLPILPTLALPTTLGIS